MSNYILARVFNQKMNVVGRHHIIEHAQTKAFLRLENPMQVTASITQQTLVKIYFGDSGE